MTKTSYLFDIEHATSAGELRELIQMASTDSELNFRARQQVRRAIVIAFDQFRKKTSTKKGVKS